MNEQQAAELLTLTQNMDGMLQALAALQCLLIGVMLACTISLVLGVWLKK